MSYPPHRSSTPHTEYMKVNIHSSSTSAAATTMNLTSYQPFLISGNIRLSHRYASPMRVDEWLRNAYIRRVVQSSNQQIDDTPPTLGSEGDIVLGDLLPTPHVECRVLDAQGLVHIVPPSPTPRPIRVLAVLSNRDSTVHANGGLVDEQGASVSSIPIVSGQPLWWLGEESGLIGHLIRDTPAQRVIGTTSSSSSSPHHQPHTTVKFSTPAMPFTIIGLVHDASSHLPMNVRSLKPVIPAALSSPSSSTLFSPSSRPRPPRLLLVGATTSTAGKTSLVCSLILALHAQHQAAAMAAQTAAVISPYNNGSRTISPPPSSVQPLRIAYVKFTGSGSLRDKLDVQSLQIESPFSPSQRHVQPSLIPAVTHCYDHVDVGLVSTYSTLPGTSERFKTCAQELLALASAPVQLQNGSEAPIDYIVGELGSDLIWAHNPLLISMPSVMSSLIGLYLITQDALSLLGVCNYLHGTLSFPPQKLVLVNSHQQNYAGMITRIRGSDVALVEHTKEHVEQTLKALVMAKEEEEELIREQYRKAEVQIAAAAATSSPSNGSSSHHLRASSNGSFLPPDGTPNAFYHSGSNRGYSDLNGAHQAAVSPSSSSAVSPNAIATNNGNGNGNGNDHHHHASVHYDCTIPLLHVANPTSSFTDLTTETCTALLRWSTESLLLMHAQANGVLALPPLSSLLPSIISSTDDMTLRSELSSVLISLTRDSRLQQAMNYQHLIKKRDAQKGKPVKMLNAPLASLGDYIDSPYYLTPALLSLPSSLAASLLSYDNGLAWLRLKYVPARVNEECFWSTYAAALEERMRGYTQQKIQELGATK